MNIHITYALLAVFATILIAPAYGQGASPITVSTDSDTYDHESKIQSLEVLRLKIWTHHIQSYKSD